MGYAPVINMIFTLIVASLIIDFLINDLSYKKLFNKYYPIILCAFASVLSYFVIFKILQATDVISSAMYNTQTLSLKDILYKIIYTLGTPINVLFFPAPFCSALFSYFLFGLVLLYIVVAYKKKKLIISLLLLFVLLIAMLTSSYISPNNIFYTYRINLFSVPYVIALLFAITVLCNIQIVKNASLICVVALILIFCNANFSTQKIWHLGNKQDEYAVDRIKNDLLKQIDFNKKYRLYSVGGLLGRRKFANITHYKEEYNELYREYYAYEYYIYPFLESSLFLSEKYNPIYGNLFIINGNTIPLLNNEFLTKNDQRKYELFSKSIPFNTENIRKWLIDPEKSKVFVYDENILIYFSENIEQYKVLMKHFPKFI